VHIEIARKIPVTIVPIGTPPSVRTPAPGPNSQLMPKLTTTGDQALRIDWNMRR
jgi:hypothetical protein